MLFIQLFHLTPCLFVLLVVFRSIHWFILLTHCNLNSYQTNEIGIHHGILHEMLFITTLIITIIVLRFLVHMQKWRASNHRCFEWPALRWQRLASNCFDSARNPCLGCSQWPLSTQIQSSPFFVSPL